MSIEPTPEILVGELQVPVKPGVYIGVWQWPMVRHLVALSAPTYDYPDEIGGHPVGGHWAYTLCDRPAWHYSDNTRAAKAVAKCDECQAQAAVLEVPAAPTPRRRRT